MIFLRRGGLARAYILIETVAAPDRYYFFCGALRLGAV